MQNFSNECIMELSIRPKLNRKNIFIAMSHPKLIYFLLRGYSSADLEREHIAIHLQRVSKMEINMNKSDPIELVCYAIDLCSNLDDENYRMLYLFLVCRYLCPNKIVETGVNKGVSSIAILKALEKSGGHLYSIDLPNITYTKDDGKIHSDMLPQGLKPGFVVPDTLKAYWELILGDSREKLPELLHSIGEIDIFHHDSMHTYDLMTFEYETVWPHLKHGGLLLSDDVGWNNAFKDFCYNHSADYRIHRWIGIARKS